MPHNRRCHDCGKAATQVSFSIIIDYVANVAPDGEPDYQTCSETSDAECDDRIYRCNEH